MADIVDMASLETAAFTNQALANRRRDQMNNTKSCRKCKNCGEMIPLERRKAIPGVRLCVDCQKELERGRH